MSDRIKRTWIVENRWQCTSCKRINLGRDMRCAECQSPKEKNEKDIEVNSDGTIPAAWVDAKFDEAAPVRAGVKASEVTDPDLVKKAKAGADWICTFCNGRVRNLEGKCVNCDAAKAESVPFASEASKATTPKRDYEGVRKGVVRELIANRRSKKYYKNKYDKNIITISAIGAFAAFLLIISLFWWLFKTHEVVATVISTTWQRTETIAERVVNHGSGWGSPFDAYNISCVSRYYGDEDCNPYDCNPHQTTYQCNCTSYDCNCRTSCSSGRNGFSSCSETCSTCSRCDSCSRTEYDTCYHRCAVYKDYCSYDYDTWNPVKTGKTSGSGSDTPKWFGLTTDKNSPVDQRLQRNENYEVVFSYVFHDNKTSTINPSFNDYGLYKIGDKWRARTSRAGTFALEVKQ